MAAARPSRDAQGGGGRFSVRALIAPGGARVAASAPAVVQIVVAATAAYSFAHFVLGHATPILAVTVTLSALGFTRDARPRRVLETVIGILVGITLSEVLLQLVGVGWWQIAVVLALTLLFARFVSPSLGFATAAGTQSALVMLLPYPEGGVFLRSLDGLVGGAVALAATALIPRDPRGSVRRETRRFFATTEDALAAVNIALELADEPAAARGLAGLRQTQGIIDAWTAALESATSIARISPFLGRARTEFQTSATLLTGVDLAARHLRVIARRIDFLVRDGVPRPELAVLVAEVSEALRMLPFDPAASRRLLAGTATGLAPALALPGARMADAVIVLLLRPLVVDLLAATGMPADDARALLPPI